MPDISALNMKDISIHTSVANDSHHFNLDDLLGQQNNPSEVLDRRASGQSNKMKISSFKCMTLSDKIADIKTLVCSKSSLDDSEVNSLFAVLNDLIEKFGEHIQKLEKQKPLRSQRVLLRKFRQKNEEMSGLTRTELLSIRRGIYEHWKIKRTTRQGKQRTRD